MLQPLIDAFRENHRLSAVLVATLVGVAVELGLLFAARRLQTRSRELRRNALEGHWDPVEVMVAPSRVVEWCAALTPLLGLFTTGIVLDRARNDILEAIRVSGTNSENADQLVANALQVSFAASAVGLLGATVAILIACVACGTTEMARTRLQDLTRGAALRTRDPSAALAFARDAGASAGLVIASILAFTGFTWIPVAIGGVVASFGVLEQWTNLALLDVNARASTWDAALRTAADRLDRGFIWSVVGTMLVTAVVFGDAWWSYRRRSRDRVMSPSVPRPISHWELMLAVVAFVIAALLAVVAEPMRRENSTKWPIGSRVGLALSIVTPHLQGSDSAVEGPLLEIGLNGIKLDRAPTNASELEQQFHARAAEFNLLHPNQPFTGRLRIACEPNTPAERVAQLLETVARAGYRAPTFVFDVPRQFERPVLGRVTLHRISGAHTIYGDGSTVAGLKPTTIPILGAKSCRQLCEQIVAARQP